MKILLPVFKMLVLIVLIGILTALFGPLVIPGILAGLFLKPRHERWAALLIALATAVGWRMAFGEWMLQIGGDAAAAWPLELMRVLMNWALGFMLVSAGLRMPRFFREGLLLGKEQAQG